MGFLRSFQSRVIEFEVENVVRKPFKRNTNDCIDCISQMKKKDDTEFAVVECYRRMQVQRRMLFNME